MWAYRSRYKLPVTHWTWDASGSTGSKRGEKRHVSPGHRRIELSTNLLNRASSVPKCRGRHAMPAIAEGGRTIRVVRTIRDGIKKAGTPKGSGAVREGSSGMVAHARLRSPCLCLESMAPSNRMANGTGRRVDATACAVSQTADEGDGGAD